MMESSSLRARLMVVCAVSGSVVLLSLQVYNHLLSDFMKKMEVELTGRSGKHEPKRRFRLMKNRIETSSLSSKPCCRGKPAKDGRIPRYNGRQEEEQDVKLDAMPLNRLMLYRGILQSKHLRGHLVPRHL